MSGMMKGLCAAAGICLLMCLFVGCNPKDTQHEKQTEITEETSTESVTEEETKLEIDLEKTGLEFWIAQNVNSVNFSKHYRERPGMFGGHQYYGTGYVPTGSESNPVDPEYCVVYTVTSYPDYSDIAQHVTEIEITDPAINVYGITVDTSFEEFERLIKEQGFEIKSSNDFSVWATKGKYTFELGKTDKKNYLRIMVEVTNREGIVF